MIGPKLFGRTTVGVLLAAILALGSALAAPPASAAAPWARRHVELTITRVGFEVVSGEQLLGYPAVGSFIRLFFDVRNDGDRPTAQGVPLGLSIDSEYATLNGRAESTARSLAPGNTRRLRGLQPIRVEPGWSSFYVILDGEGSLESRYHDFVLESADPAFETEAQVVRSRSGSEIFLHHRSGPAPFGTVANSQLSGARTWACFRPNGDVRPETVRFHSRLTLGNTSFPGTDPRDRASTELTSQQGWATTTIRVDTDALHRTMSQLPVGAPPCPRGSVAGFYAWTVDRVTSVRYETTTRTPIATTNTSVEGAAYRYA